MPRQEARPDPKNHQRAEELCSLAQNRLQQIEPSFGQSVQALRQALDILGDDPTPQADKIRQQAGELWRLLAEKVPDMETAHALLREGVQLLAGLPVGQTLEEMVKLVKLSQDVRNDLELPPNQRFPTWLGQSNAQERLFYLAGALDTLIDSRGWPSLSKQAVSYRQLLVKDYLPEYLLPLYNAARQAARNRNITLALQTTEAAWQFVPEELRPYLPPSIGSEGLLRLKEALEAHQESEETLWAAAFGLTTKKLPFCKVVPDITLNLPVHPDVSVDDLETLFDDLKKAEKIEAAIHAPTTADNYALSIYRWHMLAQDPLAIRDKIPVFLENVDPQLAHKLQKCMIDLQKSLIQAISDAVLVLSQRIQMETLFLFPDSDPYALLHSYWQVSWCLMSGVLSDPSIVITAQDALRKTQKGLHVLSLRAVETFQGVQNIDDLSHLQRILEALCKLNRGLVHFPEANDDDQLLIQLPPLPSGAFIPKTTPVLDELALEGWSKVIISWITHYTGQRYLKQMDAYNFSDVQLASGRARKLLRDLNYLKNDIWPKLGLPEWGEDSSPGRLEDEARLHLTLTLAMQKIWRNWQNMQAMDIFMYLDEQLQQPGLTRQVGEFTLWLLKPQRHYLVESANDLYQRAIDEVGEQVTNILEDRSRSVKRFQEEILTKPRSAELAEVAYNAIYSTTDKLAKAAMNSGARGEVIALWGVVHEATLPWADLKAINQDLHLLPEGVDELWHQLHHKTRRPKISMASLKRAIVVLVVALILVVMGWFGAKAWIMQPSDRDNLTASATTAGVQSTLTYQTAAAQNIVSAETAAGLNVMIQGTHDAQAGTSTAQAIIQIASTQQAAAAQAGTSTAQALVTATYVQLTALAQAATDTANDQAMKATSEAMRCRDVSAYTIEVSPEPELSPPPFSMYLTGSTTFDVTATWEVKNVGDCIWDQLVVEPLSGDQEVVYTFWRGDEMVEVTPEQPVGEGEIIEIVLSFEILDARNINEEWALVANDLAFFEQPHLKLEIQDWIISYNP